MTTTNPRSEQNKRIARRIPEELATDGDLDLVEELYAADAVEHDPFGDHTGRTAIRENVERLFATVSDFSATVEDLVVHCSRGRTRRSRRRRASGTG
jgi:ketosteroid isomerase-like protein